MKTVMSVILFCFSLISVLAQVSPPGNPAFYIGTPVFNGTFDTGWKTHTAWPYDPASSDEWYHTNNLNRPSMHLQPLASGRTHSDVYVTVTNHFQNGISVKHALNFWYKGSGLSELNQVAVTVGDWQLAPSITANPIGTEWKLVTYIVPAFTNTTRTLSFTLLKSSGYPNAWIDAVQWVPIYTQPTNIVSTNFVVERLLNQEVRVKWHSIVYKNYGLQSATILSGPWSNVTNTPTSSGGFYQVNLSSSGNGKFFRLKLPYP